MFGVIWKDEVSFGDLLTIVGFLFTLAGLIFAGWQLGQNARVQRTSWQASHSCSFMAPPSRQTAVVSGKAEASPA